MERPTLLFDKSLVIRQIPLFASLNIFEKRLLLDSAQIVSYKPLEPIYCQGDPPDAFYCIVTGRVEIFNEKDSRHETLEHLHRGKYFGFISLLTGETHSVSARAVTDTIVVKIPKENFQSILKTMPRLAIDLSQMLSRRLKRKDLHPKMIFESTILGIYADVRLAVPLARYAGNLTLGLIKQTHKKAIVINLLPADPAFQEIFGCPQDGAFMDMSVFFSPEDVLKKIVRHPAGIDVLFVRRGPQDVALVPFLVSLMTMLVNDYHYCLVPLLSSLGADVYKILAQTDAIHWIVSPEPSFLKELSRSLQRDGFFSDDTLKKKIKLIVLEEKAMHGRAPELLYQEEAALFHQPLFATLPASEKKTLETEADVEDPYSKVIRRISRQLGEVLVGLALGSGAAMGLAHIGVLKVLEKEDIPIDMVSGSSIGALIAAFWCAGYRAAEIEEIIVENSSRSYLFGWDDLIFPVHGLIRGRHIHSFLNRYLKNKTFYDIRRPLKIIACDCLTMRQVSFESGKLSDAVMASLSIPGVFQSFKIGPRYYMDGGILNPLPTDVLVQSGAKKIIAVNVLPNSEEIERTREFLSGPADLQRRKPSFWGSVGNRIARKKKNVLQPNIFDVIVSSVQSMEYAMAEWASLSQADVSLHPDMSAVFWAAFDQAPDLIRRGEEEAYLHLREIKELALRSD